MVSDMMAHNTFWLGKKVLITGINGFIGSHLAKTLYAHGAVIEGASRHPEKTPFLDHYFPAHPFTVHPLELRRAESVQALVKKQTYDVIFHLASQSDTWKSTQMPVETFESNVNGTLSLLDALRVQGTNTPLILAGSVRAFEPLSSTKTDVMAPLHPYDASKFCTQVIARSYFHAYGMPGAIAQNTNIFGPNDTNFSRLIPIMMRDLFLKKKIVLKGNGKIKRDFLYVDDAVRGMISLAENCTRKEVNGKAVTFASGRLSTIQEISEMVKESFSFPVSVDFDGKPFEDRDHPVLDISVAHELLGWEPQFTLEKGIRETVSWYEKYFATNGGIQK